MLPDDAPLSEKTIDAVCEPKLRLLFDYWQRLRRGRPMPLRADFDPVHIPALLKDLFFVEVHGAPPRWRFRYRVAGTAISQYVGEDYTGRFVDEVFPPPARCIVERFYAAAVAARRPIYSRTRLVVPSSELPKHISRLTVPLSVSGETVDLLISAQHYNRETRPLQKVTHLDDYALEELFIVRPEDHPPTE